MSEVRYFRYDVNPVWGIVEEIRKKVAKVLVDAEKSIVEATQMVASELVENAVKYGSPMNGGSGVQFRFSVNNKTIRIETSNTIAAEEDFTVVKKHLDRIQTQKDPKTLYIARLQELLDDPTDKSQLGLYRISYEGKFDLSYNCDSGIITVIAVRQYTPIEEEAI